MIADQKSDNITGVTKIHHPVPQKPNFNMEIQALAKVLSENAAQNLGAFGQKQLTGVFGELRHSEGSMFQTTVEASKHSESSNSEKATEDCDMKHDSLDKSKFHSNLCFSSHRSPIYQKRQQRQIQHFARHKFRGR